MSIPVTLEPSHVRERREYFITEERKNNVKREWEREGGNGGEECSKICVHVEDMKIYSLRSSLVCTEFDVMTFPWPCHFTKREGKEKRKKSVWEWEWWKHFEEEERGEEKEAPFRAREGHRTAESWVGGGKEQRGGPTSGPGCQRGLKFVSLPPLLLIVTQKQRPGDALPPWELGKERERETRDCVTTA